MSSIHSPSQHVAVIPQVLAAITAASNTGVAVDCLGYTRAMAVFQTAPTGSLTTSDCEVEESADGSTNWIDIASADFAQVTTVEAGGGVVVQVADINLEYRLRYLRIVHTGVGGSAAGQVEAHLEMFNAGVKPVTQAGTVAFAI